METLRQNKWKQNTITITGICSMVLVMLSMWLKSYNQNENDVMNLKKTGSNLVGMVTEIFCDVFCHFDSV